MRITRQLRDAKDSVVNAAVSTTDAAKSVQVTMAVIATVAVIALVIATVALRNTK